jgi:hypothetical protein
MAEPIDPGTRARYLSTLSEYACDGYVTFNRKSQEWILAEYGCHPKLVAKSMHTHVDEGGEIKKIRENGDPSIYQCEFHYDLVFMFRRNLLYAETLFIETKRNGERIEVVSIKFNKKN